MVILHDRRLIALVFLTSLVAEVEDVVIMLAILVHFYLALIHHHVCLTSSVFIASHELEVVVAHHVAILWNSLEALGWFEIVDSIFIQKTVLNHMWVFNVEHGVLKKNVVFSQVLAGIHLLD